MLALYGLHTTVKEFRWQSFLVQARSLSFWQIIPAMLLTAASYLVLTTYDIMGFRYIRRSVPYLRVVFASFISYAFSNNVGLSVISGGSVRYRLYSSWGIAAMDISTIVVFCGFTFGLGTLAIMGAVFVIDPMPLPALALTPGAMRFVGALLLTFLILYLTLNLVRTRPLAFGKWRLRLPGFWMSILQISICAFDLVLTGSALFMLLPLGTNIGYVPFIGIFLVANVLGHLSQVPGGLGVFESTMVFLLSPTVPVQTAVTALLLFRALYHVFPLLIGMLLLAIYELIDRGARMQAFTQLGKWSPALMPYTLSLTGFFTGTVLLFSGAIPGVHTRLLQLHAYVPLFVIELSHALGSVVGIGLIVASYGLERRLARAYVLSLVLIIAGFFLSFSRGWNYEEALVLAAALLLFLPGRKYFSRKSSLLCGRLRMSGFASILLVLLASIFLGLFSFKSIAYTPSLWWRFSLFADASRFLRATLAAAVVIIGAVIARSLRASRSMPSRMTQSDIEHAKAMITASGRALGEIIHTAKERIMFSDNGRACLLFVLGSGSAIALGDPVGSSEEDIEELVWKFREICEENDLLPAFYGIDPSRVQRYIDIGLTTLPFGEEAMIDLQKFDPGKSALHDVVQARRNLLERPCSITVTMPKEYTENAKQFADDLLALEYAPVARRGACFAALSDEYLRHVMTVRLEEKGKIIGFATLLLSEPGGEAIVDLIGMEQGAVALKECLMLECLIRAKEQGYSRCSLGITPMPGQMQLEGGIRAWMTNLLWQHQHAAVPLRAERRLIEQFNPQWEARYIASSGGLRLSFILTEIADLTRR